MSIPTDLYVILDVVRTATENDIKKAFRKLARRYHPDINPGDNAAEERFKRISEAYEVLGDPEKREFYDQNGFYSEGVLQRTEPQVSWGFSFKSFEFSESKGARDGLSDGDVFGQFFSRQAHRRDPERGQDLEYQMAVAFVDSIEGLKTRISVQRRHSCETCSGTGRAANQNSQVCGQCSGAGTVSKRKGRLHFAVGCGICGGTGRLLTDCSRCSGEGRVLRADVMEVAIPAGVSMGSRVRFQGKGDAGLYGGPPGDLYVITNVASHPFFTRTGDNLQCIVAITFAEAALGAKIEVPCVDGTAVVRIPPGTQTGQVFRLRGKGAPSLMQPGTRGDQFIEVRISVPRIADERSKEILREFAQLNSENPRKDIWRP